MDVNSARHLETDNLAPEVAAGENQRARNLALAQDALRTVDILEKHVESDHALGEPTLQELPFGTGQNARYQIEREEPFRPAIVAVHRESNSLEQKGKIGELAPLIELCRRHFRETGVQLRVVRSRLSLRGQHLVVKIAGIVSVQ